MLSTDAAVRPVVSNARVGDVRRVRPPGDGDLICDWSYQRRRAALESLGLVGAGWCTIRSLVAAPRERLDACAELDVEGVVAKRFDSPYRPGVRSGDWLKLQTAEWKSAHAAMRHRR